MSNPPTKTANQHVDSLPDDLQQWLPRLGLFIGGAQETLLLAITGLAQVGPKPNLATGIGAQDWPRLREALIQRGWIREQAVGSGRPWLHLEHASFRQAWQELDDNQQNQLKKSFRRHYFQLAGQRLKAITRTDNPAASDALWVELEANNMLQAADWAETAAEPWAAEYLQRLQALFKRCNIQQFDKQLLQALTRLLGDEAVIRQQLSDQAERNLKSGNLQAACEDLQTLLERQDNHTANANVNTAHARAATHARLGYVLTRQKDYELAEKQYQLANKIISGQELQAAQLELLLRIQLDLLGLQLLRNQPDGLETPIKQTCDRIAHLFSNTANTEFIEHSERAAWELDRNANHCKHRPSIARMRHTARRLRYLSPAGQAMVDDQQYWIQTVIQATTESGIRKQLENELETSQQEWPQGVEAIRQILDGERDEEHLCTGLELEDAVLIHAVLQGV